MGRTIEFFGRVFDLDAPRARRGRWQSFLSREQQEAIRARAAAGESQRDLAAAFGVSRPTIRRVVSEGEAANAYRRSMEE